MGWGPPEFAKAKRRRAEHNLKTSVIGRPFLGLSGLRKHQRQILENRVDVALFWDPDFKLLRTETDAGAHLPEAPHQVRAAFDGMLEPVFEFRRNVAVEENLDSGFLFARELANLQISRMRRGFPVQVARALEGLIGPDAIKVAAEAHHMRFDLANDGR